MVGRYTHAGRCAGLKTVVGIGRARHGERRAEAEKRDSIELVGDYGGNAINVCARSERFSAPVLMSIKLKRRLTSIGLSLQSLSPAEIIALLSTSLSLPRECPTSPESTLVKFSLASLERASCCILSLSYAEIASMTAAETTAGDDEGGAARARSNSYRSVRFASSRSPMRWSATSRVG